MDRMKLILGTMNFGPQVNESESLDMLNLFFDYGFDEIDTAYVYNDGEAENILGSILNKSSKTSAIIGTKVNPRITGKLDADAVYMQISESLKRIGKNTIDILYFHFPDQNTPIESALCACNDLYKDGKIKELGLSNFPAWMVVDIWHICKENGWIRPSVYQGMYNGLSRKIEVELLPALRKLNIRFYAFNPLAGGMLTGKHISYEETPMPGRFSRLQSYRSRYWKKSFFDAVEILTKECRKVDIEPAEAAFRWLAYHSSLSESDGDAIIVGASNIKQLEQNINATRMNELPNEIVNVFNVAWEEAKPNSPEYFRFYSK